MNSRLPSPPKNRVLLVDDDPDIHKLVAAFLRRENIELLLANGGSDAIDVARRELPDLILLDYDMPGANGLEILARLRDGVVPASTPVVFVTGNNSHHVLTGCFKAGAADYISKPFCAPELRARVRAQLDRRQMQRQLETLALFDTLTNLPNRASILCSIQDTIDRNDGTYFALLFLDFDGFKLINDSLGHEVGDKLLKEIACRLLKDLRMTDRIHPARLGGDEFVVLLEGLTSPADAITVTERLLQSLSQPYQLGTHTVYSTASIGVVTNEHRYEKASDIVRDADLAMYRAKSSGKACYAVFDQTLREKAQSRLAIETGLREAISRNELVLAYQPIISLETGRMTAVEALLRWIHTERGLVSPHEFISVAEETGIIVPIGSWVLDESCRQYAEWRRTLPETDRLACIHVNVSRKQLLSPDLVRVVEQVLTKHDVPPECLHLEVTESVIMTDPQFTIAVLNNLRRLGVKIDMDDFGTGYSSLSCLHKFPLDVLKIDRTFITNVNRVRDLASLLHAVLTLADNLGLQVVAEGIEDAEQLAMLQALGCEYGQGYFFAKPLPAGEIGGFTVLQHRTASRESDVSPSGVPTSIFVEEILDLQHAGVEA